MSRVFFDSNVLIYAFGGDDPRKRSAKALVAIGGVVSVQCLNEFASVGRRKGGMSWEKLDEAVAIIVSLVDRVLPIDLAIHHAGLRIAERYKLSVYDAMIAAAALVEGCDTLYSEDMHDGLVIDGSLRVVNPFA